MDRKTVTKLVSAAVDALCVRGSEKYDYITVLYKTPETVTHQGKTATYDRTHWVDTFEKPKGASKLAFSLQVMMSVVMTALERKSETLEFETRAYDGRHLEDGPTCQRVAHQEVRLNA